MSADRLQFIAPDGNGNGTGVLQATSVGQVLQATAGVSEMADAGQLGATFTGSLAQLTDVFLASFTSKDVIDVTDLRSANAVASYSGTSNSGVLHLSAGSVTGDIRLAGQFGDGIFHVSSDQHGGSLIEL